VYALEGKRVWVAGHRGLLGCALLRRLKSENCEIVTVDRASVDLTDQTRVREWMAAIRPQTIFLVAAKVGGIHANSTYWADFIYENLMIEANVIDAAHRFEVEKLLFVASAAAYPEVTSQPIREDALLTGPLDRTKQWYAVAKIAGIKLGQAYRGQHGRDFISALPNNLYGPDDNFDLETSHVIPALIRKADEAKRSGAPAMTIWGTGTARREFLYADDCADACVHLMKHYSAHEHVNVGSGEDIAIIDLARLVCEVVGFEGEIVTDLSKPDGALQRLLSSERLRALGWAPAMPLHEGIAAAYRAFLEKGH